MKIKILLLSLFLCSFMAGSAQNWDYIRESGDYYYSEGHGTTMDEADSMAKQSLINSISVTISSNLIHLLDEMNKNGKIDSEQRMQAVIESSSQATLSGMQSYVVSSEPPNCIMRYYIEKSAVDKMYAERVKRAKEYIKIADERLDAYKLDAALQYYYWAYSLIRSVKNPYEVKDDKGRVILEQLSMHIEEIANDIEIHYNERDGERVEFSFTYKGHPVKSLDFTYNDGKDECVGCVTDGLGIIEVYSSHLGEVYHIDIEYEHKNRAKDPEIASVLEIGKIPIPKASKKIRGVAVKENSKADKAAAEITASRKLKPKSSQLLSESAGHEKVMETVLDAINKRHYTSVASLDYFTGNGLDIYERLISYGSGRVVGIPDILYFKGTDGSVIARGLRMSFSFSGRGRKSTFIEDVVFTFNNEGKIDNISFGLGVDATNSILCKRASAWSDEARETITAFLENYKTAYSLKRHDYIGTIFSDDAVIIRGTVIKVKPGYNPASEGKSQISAEGQTIIKYNKETKTDYLAGLKKRFAINEFINIRFPSLDVQKLVKYKDKELYGIQLRQEYYSSTYSDTGYLFLLIDFTNKEEPLITVRTWQPNEEDMEKLYTAGSFFRSE